MITGHQYRINKYIKILGSFLSIFVGLMCLFVAYPDSIRVPGLSRSAIVAYVSLSRPLWSIVIGWIIFLCCINQGGIINNILAWSIWSPFSST
jgi:ABC-type uncharacterized transport system permease subunit